MNFLITGGTGFIGKCLIQHLTENGHNITVLTRNKNKTSGNIKVISDVTEIKSSDKIDVIINLAGAPISKRWSKAYKQELIDSRVNTTKDIISLIERLKNKPDILISTSAIGYYGSQGDKTLDENSTPLDEFTHQLCKKWESEALEAEKYGVRVCITRLGVVLGKNGGALKQMLPAFKLGVGGRLGDGNQYFSWVHIKDVIYAFSFLIENKNEKGVYNLTAPHPVTNNDFTKALGKAINRPTAFPMPAFIVKLLFGEMGETLLLNGQRVLPRKLQESGFQFQYSKIENALKDVV